MISLMRRFPLDKDGMGWDGIKIGRTLLLSLGIKTFSRSDSYLRLIWSELSDYDGGLSC